VNFLDKQFACGCVTDPEARIKRLCVAANVLRQRLAWDIYWSDDPEHTKYRGECAKAYDEHFRRAVRVAVIE
jgi:hypothetical protein